MRKNLLIISIITAAFLALVLACNSSSASNKKKVKEVVTTNQDMVKRGNYLVNIIGCDDCHSPKRMGEHEPEIIPELRLSGYPSSRPISKVDSNVIKNGWMLFGSDLTSSVGPWGMSFAANLTSDATGIGNWTASQFMKAIREGKWKGLDESRPLLPPMPWFIYKNMTDQDLQSIFAYLKTIPPVKNVVPAPKQLKDIK